MRLVASPLRRHWTLVSLVVLSTIVWAFAPYGGITIRQAATAMFINMILVVGLFLFVGNSGLFSFGHTAFMAIGAYVTALLTMPVDVKKAFLPSLPGWIASMHTGTLEAILIGGAIAAVAAAVVGIPIARMQPLPASLATFAVLAIVFNTAQNLDAIGGSTGIAQIPVRTSLDSALLWALAAIAFAYCYGLTRSAIRLRASREDEVAARAVGIPVVRDRYLSFVLSAILAGVAGGVYALYIGFFTPSSFFLTAAFLAFVMLLVGGMISLSGAVVGTIVVAALQEILRRAEGGFSLGFAHVPARPGLQNVVLAALLILIMIKRPSGIVGGRDLPWPSAEGLRRFRRDPPPRSALDVSQLEQSGELDPDHAQPLLTEGP